MVFFALRTSAPLRNAAILCLFATVIAIVCGCERQVAPPLVEVTDVAPLEVEPGDRLEIHGKGFPQGRTAQITFEGTLHRASAEPERGVVIQAEGITTTTDRVELVVRESLADRFCGRGDAAAHATFRGEIRVGFASSTPGAPPLVGRLREAALDVLPSAIRANVQDARVNEGTRVLAYLGLVTSGATARGLPIEQVRTDSIAEKAGLVVGDVLVAVDGVHVLGPADVLPVSARSAEIVVRRADSGIEETKSVSMSGYATERVPAEFAPALLLVGFALVLLVLLVLPGPLSLSTLEWRIATRLRTTTLSSVAKSLVGHGSSAAVSVIVSAVLAAFAIAPYVVARELDGVMLLASATAMLVWSRVALERGFFASVRALLRLGAAALAMIGAVVIGIGQLGAIELGEIVRIQGGAPWQFTAARHPACAILLGVYVLAMVTILRNGDHAAMPPHARYLERVGLLLGSALGVTTFLGGWNLPAVNDPRTRLLLLAAAGLFLLKTWLVAGITLAASRLSTKQAPSAIVPFVAKRLLPALVVAALVVAASRRLVPSVALETAFGGTLVALAALFVVRLAARVRAVLARPEPHASPFL